mmetsp:Transcript_23158/g.62802  ORF Transcript_23158/g.62802 Transcript_23158/m.62802 type:complete len:240 (+) Transcript_23158:1114-1833(+)
MGPPLEFRGTELGGAEGHDRPRLVGAARCRGGGRGEAAEGAPRRTGWHEHDGYRVTAAAVTMSGEGCAGEWRVCATRSARRSLQRMGGLASLRAPCLATAAVMSTASAALPPSGPRIPRLQLRWWASRAALSGRHRRPPLRMLFPSGGAPAGAASGAPSGAPAGEDAGGVWEGEPCSAGCSGSSWASAWRTRPSGVHAGRDWSGGRTQGALRAGRAESQLGWIFEPRPLRTGTRSGVDI